MRPAWAREIVDHLRTCFRVSVRRVFRAVPAPRSTFHYRSRKPGQAILRQRIREIAQTRVRYGYRRIHVLLRREGWVVNPKRVHRLYRLEGLQMRHKPPRRRVMAKLREDRAPATAPNQVWAMDWVYDQSSRFHKPVYAGDTLYPALVVGELAPRRTTGVVGLNSTVHNQRRELVLDGTMRFIIRKREPARG